MTQIYNPHEGTIAEAYAAGFELRGYYPERMTDFEVAEAIENWKDALSDHGHVSFWGRENIRKSIAYFLGIARRKRADR